MQDKLGNVFKIKHFLPPFPDPHGFQVIPSIVRNLTQIWFQQVYWYSVPGQDDVLHTHFLWTLLSHLHFCSIGLFHLPWYHRLGFITPHWSLAISCLIWVLYIFSTHVFIFFLLLIECVASKSNKPGAHMWRHQRNGMASWYILLNSLMLW